MTMRSLALLRSHLLVCAAVFLIFGAASSCRAQGDNSLQEETVAPEFQKQIPRTGGRIDFGKLWVFSAGVHKFEDDHLHPGRQAVVFQDIGFLNDLVARGVPQDQIIGLRDEQATTANCSGQLQALAKRAGKGDTLLVFAHSHGSSAKGGLICTYEVGGTWHFQDMIQQIESSFVGARVCICVCACHSGSLIDAVRSAPRKLPYFCVTSVHDDVNALTVATSDFEACLRDAFRGSPCPDINKDGVITFRELGKYVTREQSVLFGTVPDYSWTDNFDPEMIVTDSAPRTGPADCCLVRLRNGVAGRVIKQENNRILVRGSKNPQLVEWSSIDNATPLSR